MAVVQRLKDTPQVPAQTVVQALPGEGQRLQQLLQAVVSTEKQAALIPVSTLIRSQQCHCHLVFSYKLEVFKTVY